MFSHFFCSRISNAAYNDNNTDDDDDDDDNDIDDDYTLMTS